MGRNEVVLCFCFSACVVCFGSLSSESEAARARCGGRGAAGALVDSVVIFLFFFCFEQIGQNGRPGGYEPPRALVLAKLIE